MLQRAVAAAMKINNRKALPCPFCGIKPTIRMSDIGLYGRDCWIICESKRCMVQPHAQALGVDFPDDPERLELALAAWNARPKTASAPRRQSRRCKS